MTPAEVDALLARLDDHESQYTEHTDLWQEAAALIRELRQANERFDARYRNLDERLFYAEQRSEKARASLAQAQRELTGWRELRRVIAEELGENPETWPDHGNAPLALAATFMLHKQAAERNKKAHDEAQARIAKLTACVERADDMRGYVSIRNTRRQSYDAARAVLEE